MASPDSLVVLLEKVGWFIPPYINMGQIESIIEAYNRDSNLPDQDRLNATLATIYSKENISSVFVEKYSVTPFVKDYLNIIDNGIKCHFLGLNYASVSTLIPVVEGITRKLAAHRNINVYKIKSTIKNLCTYYKSQVIKNEIGDFEEIDSMIDSFEHFIKNKLYSDSKEYPHEDNTNRNGIAHGAYSDMDFGNETSFYKVIALINFLCFLCSIDAGLSWFPPKGSELGDRKAMHLSLCQKFSSLHGSNS